jgi:hypothetical protein
MAKLCIRRQWAGKMIGWVVFGLQSTTRRTGVQLREQIRGQHRHKPSQLVFAQIEVGQFAKP